LIATRYPRIASTVSSGSHTPSPYTSTALPPAYISIQEILLAPPYAFSTAAFHIAMLALVTSPPIPSPSMNATIGLSDTTGRPSSPIVILSPGTSFILLKGHIR
jgi:hypothetical protein